MAASAPATKMFKITKGLVSLIFLNDFNKRNKLDYNLRHASHFNVPLVNSFLGPKIWDMLPNKITVEALQGPIKMEIGKLFV